MTRYSRAVAIALAILLSTLILHGSLPEVSTGSWQPVGTMVASRSGAASVKLLDGQVMFIGGIGSNGAMNSAEVFGNGGAFSAVASMSEARSAHTATLLDDGRVLVAGGDNGNGATNTIEIYDPAFDSWSSVGALLTARSGHTASRLKNGNVLIAGGDNAGGPLSTLEVFDPRDNSVSNAGTMAFARAHHAAAVMGDGRVMIAGGSNVDADSNTVALSSVEIYDPADGSVSAAANLSTARASLSATTLLDGRVFVAGGNDGSQDLVSAEVFDAASNSWSATGSMVSARSGHSAFLLPNNNNVMIVGGTSAGVAQASVELFASWNNSFRATTAMTSVRAGGSGSALANNGLFLMAGGAGNTNGELYRFATVMTDADDYAPGTPVYITGSGWQPGETVTISLEEVPFVDQHESFTTVADADGNILDFTWAPDEDDLNLRFYLTAKGSASESYMTFTDSRPNSLTVGAQNPSPIVPTGSATYLITVGFAGGAGSCTVDLTVSGLTSGASGAFSLPGSVITISGNGSATSTLTVSTTGAIAPSSTGFTVTGTPRTGCSTPPALSPVSNTGTLLVAGPATHFSVTGFPNPATAGTAGNFTVKALDVNNNTAINYTGTVTFTSSDSQAVLPSNYTFVSGDAGAHTFSATLKTSGSQSITATEGAKTGSQTVTVNAAAAHHLAFSVQPSDTLFATIMSPAVKVQVFDQFNNLSSANVSLAIGTNPASPAGTLTGGGSVASVAGVATFAGLSINNGADGYTLVASDGVGVTTATSNPFNITRRTTTTSLGSSLNPSNLGQSVTFSSDVDNGLTGSNKASGSVTFYDGATPIGTDNLNGSAHASVATSALTGGSHNITAVYNGDPKNSPSTSSTVIQVVITDSTPPVITPVITGTLGSNGWYTSNVGLTWTVTDAESTVSSTTGCGASSVTSDTTGVSFTCSATSAGGTSSNTVTIKRDASGPSATLSVTAGTAGSNGWYTSNVTVHTAGTDSISGIASCTADQNQVTETAGQSFNGSCTNNAGTTTNAAPLTVKLDKTGPSANLAVSAGTLGDNGWYISNVTIHTSGTDTISSPVTCSADQFQTTDTASATFNGSCTNDAGLSTNAASLNMKRDATKPSATATPSRGADHNAWYNHALSVSYAGTDATSGIASCDADSNYSGPDSASGSVSGSCKDNAGNVSDTAAFNFKYDGTAPSASLSVTAGTAGTNSWYTSDVTVHAAGSDSTSGIESCSADQFQTSETTGQSFNGSCTDNAGNTGNAAPLSVKLDKTGPSASLTPSGTLGDNGWYISNVTISASGSDSISSPVSCTADQFQNSDTTGTPFNGSCTNDAGLSTNAAEITVKRDATKPSTTAAANRVTDHNGWYNHALSVSYSGTDATSGIASCDADSNYSGPDSASASVSGTCKDNAGNVSDAAAYNFKYDATAPSSSLSVTAGTAGTNGWYTSDVTVHTAGTDDMSGIASCSTDQFQTAETTGHEFNGSCTDEAGNTGNAAPLSVKLDKTGPSASLAPSGTLGSNGWYVSNVTVSTSGSDSISSPVNCTADQFQTTDTNGAPFNGSCTNDAGLSTNAAEITVKRDATKPSATATPSHGTDHNGWYNHALSVSYSGSDATSGIAGCDADSNYSGPDSASASVSGTCTDNAGNVSDPAAFNFKYDATGPSALLTPTGTAGTNGWFIDDVTITTSGSDAVSGPTVCSAVQYQTGETTGQLFSGSCTNDAGLTTNASDITVKLDKTAPSAALSIAAGTLGANGWYTSDVTVSTSGSDSIGNPVTCTADQYQTTETTGTAFNGSCTNDAGLSTNATSLSVKLDKTGPSASLAVTAGTLGSNGWYTSNVTVSTSGSDSISGPAVCSADQYQTAETTGTVFNGSCTNNAGLSTNAASLTVKLDKTGPSASLAVSAGTLGNNGWYVSNITISASGSDSISGPAVCTADQYQTTDTTGASFNGSCTNNAGLSTNAAVLSVKLDKTKPTLGPTLANPILLNGSYSATPGAGDATSGVASQSCGPVVTSTVGAKTLTCNATDNAGNTNSANVDYTVVYATGGACLGEAGHQILQPINWQGDSISKQGSTVPAKFRVCDALGHSISTPGVVSNFALVGIISGLVTTVEDLPVDSTTPDNMFRWSASDQQWIFNISTKNSPFNKNKTYLFRITLNDGSVIDFRFGLK